jgi:arylsulfatase A-like enzyme
LMGPGITAGSYAATVALNDVAPTVAVLLGIAPPGGATGRALTEALAPAPAPPRPRGTR